MCVHMYVYIYMCIRILYSHRHVSHRRPALQKPFNLSPPETITFNSSFAQSRIPSQD